MVMSGAASALFGLAFHDWMKVGGRQKWKRMTWSVVAYVCSVAELLDLNRMAKPHKGRQTANR